MHACTHTPQLVLLFWQFPILRLHIWPPTAKFSCWSVSIFWSAEEPVDMDYCVRVFVSVHVRLWLRQQRMWVFAQMRSQIIKRYIKSQWWQNLRFRYEHGFLRLLFTQQLPLFFFPESGSHSSSFLGFLFSVPILICLALCLLYIYTVYIYLS